METSATQLADMDLILFRGCSNWAISDRQELIDIVEVVYRGASKGRGLVISPKGKSWTQFHLDIGRPPSISVTVDRQVADATTYCFQQTTRPDSSTSRILDFDDHASHIPTHSACYAKSPQLYTIQLRLKDLDSRFGWNDVSDCLAC